MILRRSCLHQFISGGSFNKPLTKSTTFAMSASRSGINSDGTLKKYVVPLPTTQAALAAFNGDHSLLSSLPATNLLAIDETGNTPLIWSADQGHIDTLNLILEAVAEVDPSSVNTRGYLGNTALSRAARSGHVDCVIALLKIPEINPNISNDKMQYPLHFAAFKRKPDVVKVLLEHKACDSTVVDRKGRTPAEDTSDDGIRNMILESRRPFGAFSVCV
jgi:ankyrin repeat protein